jgi:glutamate carboxypeptidase
MPELLGRRIRDHVARMNEDMVGFLMEFATMETPTTVPASQDQGLSFMSTALEELGFRTRRLSGRVSGGQLLAVPRRRVHGAPLQLLLGHSDTVWPLGTLELMPVVREGGRIRGPGVFDMKGGLTLVVFALRALRELGLEPPLTPVVFVNTDEEVGSPDSRHRVAHLARRVERAFVPEPSFGPGGAFKTARKGVGTFEIRLTGKAAHSGLDPDGGASAVNELAHLIQSLHGMNDREAGVSVNVGVVEGGTRSNVIAAEARAEVDVRVLTLEEGLRMEERIRSIRPVTPGVTLEVHGGVRIPPVERTPRNRALWHAAVDAGAEFGAELTEVVSGGGSDGNTTSQHTATLDGMGMVGDGAHAPHEFIDESCLVERCTLLARLLMLESLA